MGFVRRFFSSAAAVLGFTASIFQLLGIASVGSLLLPDAYKPQSTYLIWVVIGLGLTFGAASSIYMAILGVRNIRQRLARPFDLIAERYELIIRPTEIVQLTRLSIRYYRSGHYTFPHRYYWSGTAKPVITVRSPVAATYLEVGQSQHWTIGQFVFAQIIRRSEVVQLEFEHSMPRTIFQAYVSRITEDSVGELTLKVRLEDGTSIASVAQLVNENPTDEGAAQSVPTAPARTDEHEWRIPQTRAHTQYMLGWIPA